MSPFAQSISLPHASNRRSLRFWLSQHVSWMNLVSFVAVVVLCLIYIVQVNQTVTKGYLIRDLESQIHDLTLQNQKLEITTQRAQSLENVVRATTMLGLIASERPDYLNGSDPSYVMAQERK